MDKLYFREKFEGFILISLMTFLMYLLQYLGSLLAIRKDENSS
jgi:hypothetical protein